MVNSFRIFSLYNVLQLTSFRAIAWLTASAIVNVLHIKEAKKASENWPNWIVRNK